jgi:GAF domain-containing protein
VSHATDGIVRTLGSDEGPTERPGAAGAALVPLLSDYLDDVAARTAARVGDVAGVAVSMRVDDAPMTVGASNEFAAEVDQIQYEIGVGPCLYALQEGIVMYVADLAADRRWQSYGSRAAAHGAASCISVPVMVGQRPVAVLKVYSGAVDGLDPDQQAAAATAAADVAGGIGLAMHLTSQARALDDRESAMDTRRTIDLALGILMERNRTDAAEAFTLLKKYSQHSNVKLREVARQIVATVPQAGDGDLKSPFKTPTRPKRSTTARRRTD